MWVTLYIIGNKQSAEKIVQLLSDEGLLARINPVYKNLTTRGNQYEIQVLQSEAHDARNVLVINGFLK